MSVFGWFAPWLLICMGARVVVSVEGDQYTPWDPGNDTGKRGRH